MESKAVIQKKFRDDHLLLDLVAELGLEVRRSDEKLVELRADSVIGA